MSLFVKDKVRIFSISYTAWAFYILAVLTILPDVLYFAFELDINPIVIGWLTLLAIVFGLIGRALDQPKKNKWIRRAIIAVFVFVICCISVPALAHEPCEKTSTLTSQETPITVELIKLWEGEHKIGEWHVGYLDTIAEPDLPTACYGHTLTAIVGKRYTQEECDDLLAKDILVYRDGVRSAMNIDTLTMRLTDQRAAAYTSLTYNIGIRAASKSTSVRRLNNGDIKGACTALTWFRRSGGRVVRGLVNRRNAEYEYCMKGVA